MSGSVQDRGLFGPLSNSGYFQSFMHPEKAYKNAQEAENKGWDEAKHYQEPYWQQGNDQYDRMNQASQNLFDPAKLQSDWANSYENSPYAKRALEMNQQQGQEAASSMGLGGSSAALSNIQQGAGDIVQKDRQQYMDDLMKKYMAGIGLSENIYGQGAGTAANLGQESMRHGENQGGLEYGRTQAPGHLFGQVVGTALNWNKPGSGDAFTGQNQGGNKYNQ